MIRKMEVKDADRVYQIENQAFFEPWSKKELMKELVENKILKHYVYEIDGKVAGFYIVSLILDEVEIFTIAVDKDFRGRKIASKMLEHLIKNSKEKNVKKIWLEVSTINEVALGLYKKYGFKTVRIRKNYYYKTNEDAYIMVKEIL